MLKLIAFVLPLGLDTFAISAALGLAGLDSRQRLRIGLLFMAFEGGMPLVGLALGATLGAVIGGLADWVAILVLVVLGAYMLVSKDGDEHKASLLARTEGIAILGLAVSISLDELAIGFTLGLVHVPIALAVLLIAVQALVLSQVGMRLGSRFNESVREGAEKAAGGILILLGIGLMGARLVGVSL